MLDFILAILVELFVEGTVELSKNVKVPKAIRYPLLGLIILFILAVIVGIFILGFNLLTEDILLSVVIFIIGAVFILMRQEDSDLYRSGMNCRQPVRADFFLDNIKICC